MTPEELLLQELKSVMDNAGKSVEEEQDNEAMTILGLLSKEFDGNEFDKPNSLYAFKVIPASEVMEQDDSTVVHRSDVGNSEDIVVGGKISHLVSVDTPEDLLDGISDQESMTLIAYKEDPYGLMARAKYDSGDRFTVMAMPTHVVTERRSATGNTVTKCYRTEGDKPEDLETYTELEQNLIRNIWQGLMMPMQYKREYPKAFESLGREIEAKWRERLTDGDTE